MSKTLTRVIVTLLIFRVLSLSLLAIGTIQDAEARRVHDCGYWISYFCPCRGEWIHQWVDDWRFHGHQIDHDFTC